MTAKLLSHTPDPERAIAVAASVCYSEGDATTIGASMDDADVGRMIANLKRSGHLTPFEHASFTFDVSGVSRTLTHQLVRHRLASFNQQSQRYVEMASDGMSFGYVVPPSIDSADADPDTGVVEEQEAFHAAMTAAWEAYRELIDLGVPKEDARYVLPNACMSNIVVTMNARELMHFFSLRCCNRAQWEIRELAWQMLGLCRNVAPRIFDGCGPGCVRGACPEGKMTCGKPYPV